MNLFTLKKWRHRCRERPCGHSWGKERLGEAEKVALPYIHFSSVQLLCRVWLFATPCSTARQASLSISNSQSWLKLISIESVMPSNHLILCRPLLPPSIFPSIRVFSNESALHIKWPKLWSLASTSVLPMNTQDIYTIMCEIDNQQEAAP